MSKTGIGSSDYFVVSVTISDKGEGMILGRNLLSGEETLIPVDAASEPKGNFQSLDHTQFSTGDTLAGLEINPKHTRKGKLGS